ncbi:MAG: hypothetical protein JOZ17_06615 [Acetobacteraceae bacterium]|nr:hypothetical protein [Acetobacteraceae bacterium]
MSRDESGVPGPDRVGDPTGPGTGPCTILRGLIEELERDPGPDDRENEAPEMTAPAPDLLILEDRRGGNH